MSFNKNKTKHIHTDTREREQETFYYAAVVASIAVVSLNDQMGMIMINTIRIHGPQSKAAYLATKTNPKTEKTTHHHHRLVSNTFHTFETNHYWTQHNGPYHTNL